METETLGTTPPAAPAGAPAVLAPPTPQVDIPAAPAAPSGGQEAAPSTPVQSASSDRTDKASLRRAEREAGKRKLQLKLDQEAKALGYESHADLLSQVRAQKAEKPAAPAAEPEVPAEAGDDGGSSRVAALQAHIETLEKQANRHQREVRMLRKEMQMRELCYKNGVSDVEFTTQLLAKAAGAASGEFDPTVFFKALKKERPYLFGAAAAVESRPATTVADDSPPPAPGKTERVVPRKVAKDMSPAEFRDWKKKNIGLRHPFG